MRSSFFELNIGSYGLFAAQQGLQVTSNNITNANTDGYSRQILKQKAGTALPANGTGMVGTGVDVQHIERVRNSYLDMKMWNQNPTLGEYRVKSEQLSLVESVFGEPSDAGFTTLFDDLYRGIDNLSKIPDESERKFALMQQMKSFTNYFNGLSSSLNKYQKDLNFEVKSKVDEINIISRRVESLNRQIYQAELHGGNPANALRDERELQVDRLSELINVEAGEYELIGPTGSKEKNFMVRVNGQVLVDHLNKRELEISIRDEKENSEDVKGLYDIQWKDGINFNIYDKNLSGELKGALDMRDGNGDTVSYRGIPYYISRLDNFVATFARDLNEVYKEGVDADGNKNQLLFGFTDEINSEEFYEELEDLDEEGILDFYKENFKAGNFQVSQEILDDVSSIRVTDDVDKLPGGNDILLALMETKHDRKMFKEGEANDYMVSIFSELGINAKEANMYQESQRNITSAIENQRLSISQVDQNEEMISLVKYQQAYQAAARIISTMDGIYDIMINRMGAR